MCHLCRLLVDGLINWQEDLREEEETLVKAFIREKLDIR